MQFVQITCTTRYTLYGTYRSHVHYSIHSRECTDFMFSKVHTVQYVQNLMYNTKHALYSMYGSHVQHSSYCTVCSYAYTHIDCYFGEDYSDMDTIEDSMTYKMTSLKGERAYESHCPIESDHVIVEHPLIS